MTTSIQSFVHDLLTTTSWETFLQDSEAFASELLENLEEMFPLYYMHSDICTPKHDEKNTGTKSF